MFGKLVDDINTLMWIGGGAILLLVLSRNRK